MCLCLSLQALLEQSEASPSDAAEHSGSGVEAAAVSPGWQEVAQLLGRKHDRIDPVQALPLLPLQVTSLVVEVPDEVWDEIRMSGHSQPAAKSLLPCSMYSYSAAGGCKYAHHGFTPSHIS